MLITFFLLASFSPTVDQLFPHSGKQWLTASEFYPIHFLPPERDYLCHSDSFLEILQELPDSPYSDQCSILDHSALGRVGIGLYMTMLVLTGL